LSKKLREVTKKVAGDPSFVERVETPGDEVYSLNSIGLEKFMDEDSKRMTKLFAEIIKETQKK
jgi:hypothetical protein